MLRSAATVVISVCHPAPRHFTLLVVRKTGATIETSGVGLRYFDYLSVAQPGRRSSAEALLHTLSIVQPLPLRHNSARQAGSDCGFTACHYAEEHLRFAAGQGFATQGWPEGARMRAIRTVLTQVTVALEKERIKRAGTSSVRTPAGNRGRRRPLLRRSVSWRRKASTPSSQRGLRSLRRCC